MSPDTAQPVPSDKIDPAPAVDRKPEPTEDVDAAAVSPEPAPVAPPPMSPLARSRLRRVVTVGGTLLVLFVLWETFTYFIAYTDDAYVRSDLVAVAPEFTSSTTRPSRRATSWRRSTRCRFSWWSTSTRRKSNGRPPC
jgi:multidrug efflux system membrane fusion protein